MTLKARLLTASLVLFPLCTQVVSSSLVEAQPREQSAWTYADHIAQMDVVGEAIIVSRDTTVWVPTGRCGAMGSAVPTMNLHLQVKRLIAGTLVTRTVLLRTLAGYPTVDQAIPGVGVFFWGLRLCEDDWNLWGKCLLVTANGKVDVSPNLDRRLLMSPDGSRYLNADEIRSKLDNALSNGAIREFANPKALIAVRVTNVILGTPHRGVTCDGIRIDEGSDWSSQGFRVAFRPRQRYGWHAPAVGDTLVVPLHGNAMSTSIELQMAPNLCTVRNGYVRALGTSYESRMIAYRSNSTGLQLKPYQDSVEATGNE